MLNYLVRRFLYMVPILVGVNLLTFVLFFFVHTPDSMARSVLGDRYADPAAIEAWKREHGYDLPRLWNAQARGLGRVTRTIFWQKCMPLLWLDFGRSDFDQHSIGEAIRTRMGPSLHVTVPMFLLSFGVTTVTALWVAYRRGGITDRVVLVLCVAFMSVSPLFYIIGGQYLFARVFRWCPFSGYAPGLDGWRFVVLPVAIGVLAGFGQQVRFNRTVMLEETQKDYVRTARAKGVSEPVVLLRHILRNALIPILTSVVVTIPFLIMGNLLLENFFGIPGLGSYVLDAIQRQDFAVVRAVVYLGTLLYMAGLLMVDLAYTWADPRVRLG